MIYLLAERFRCTQQVGALKARETCRRPIRRARPGR
jgi:chorismate mutase